MLSVGRFPNVARWLKRYLVNVLINRKYALAIDFRRTITFADDEITVLDDISGADGKQIDTIRAGELFTTVHMGSSRYFIKNELNEFPVPELETITSEQVVSGLTLTRVVPIQKSTS
jgi:hypothetical protein